MQSWFIVILIMLSSSAPAAEKAKEKKLFELFEENKFYYSALDEFFKETYFREVTNDDLAKLEELLYYTGIELLEDYDEKLLMRFPSSSTRFILGRNEMHAKRYEKALEYFGKVHPDHRYFPESKLLEAQVYALLGKVKDSFESFDKCLSSAEKNEKDAPTEKIKRYYRMAYEICLVNKARHFFKVGDYQGAINAYDKIPKVSYKWPYLLLEKAWVYYQMGDYNRALGLLVTYKSPLLDTYFFPEAEYLAALSYFRLCLYEDSLTIIDQYYQFYRPRFAALEKVLRSHMGSQDYFFHLMFKKSSLDQHDEFVRHIVTRMKKQIRFSLDFNSVYKIDKERRFIEARVKEPKLKERLLAHLAHVQSNMVSKINYNAKKEIFEFLQSVPFYSSELFKLNLEIISRKRDLIYRNRKLIADRSRGDYSNVKRSRFEQFWTFQGAFWADELGDYSLGLKSNCETVKQETAQQGAKEGSR